MIEDLLVVLVMHFVGIFICRIGRVGGNVSIFGCCIVVTGDEAGIVGIFANYRVMGGTANIVSIFGGCRVVSGGNIGIYLVAAKLFSGVADTLGTYWVLGGIRNIVGGSGERSVVSGGNVDNIHSW